MRRSRLSVALLLSWVAALGAVDSPHGPLTLACDLCHSTQSWALRAEPDFHHDLHTDWPLEGAHQRAACLSCHVDHRFQGMSVACLDCHLDPHEATLGDGCLDCHSPASWQEGGRWRARHERSRFPLSGAHGQLACNACHSGSPAEFRATPRDCAACHRDDWVATTDPPHAVSGLDGDCALCHDTRSWSRAGGFAHGAFPLTGAHAGAACAGCHVGNVYRGTPSACLSCHQPQYLEAPNHVLQDYPVDCAICHSTSAWRPSVVDHDRTDFPLTGAHRTVSCGACHTQGTYQGLDTACSSCHLADFQATGSPDHESAGFPLSCADCHTTTSWAGATFDHDQSFFPIYSGAHRGEWTSCADCHSNAASFSDFSCLGCHEHNRADMDEEHDEVGGYQWDSQSCLGCHPAGEANDRVRPAPRTRDFDLRPRHPMR